MKTGLVLEGGAMRGLFSMGVVDVMMENGIVTDGMIGVSAGAAFGCNYKSEQPGRVIRYCKRFAKNWRFCSVRSLLLTGNMFGGNFGYIEIPEYLDPMDVETFKNNPMEFYLVATDVNTGKPIYKKLEDARRSNVMWMRGSASMPMAAQVVDADGYHILDGGTSDSIPVRYFESIGYRRSIVVLTQPKGFVKPETPHMELVKVLLKDYPAVIEALRVRHTMYNEETAYVEQREREGADLVIRPPETLPVSHVTHDPAVMQQVYDIGRAAAEPRVAEMKQFLEEVRADRQG